MGKEVREMNRYSVCFFIALFCGLFLSVVGVVPFHDDWTYATAPNVAFAWTELLPREAFWRPFDVLWGALMGLCPAAFPIANRVVIVLGHCLNAMLLFMLLGRMKGSDRRGRIIATAFFACSSAIAAVIVNTDTVNQVWSFFFGLLSLYFALGDRKILSFVMIVVSILFKESGVSWLAVVPLAAFAEGNGTDRYRGLLIGALVGACVLIGYFALRFLLCGGITLGGGGYYELGFNPVSILKNLAIAIILPLSGVDGFALVTGRIGIAVASIFLAAAFWDLVLARQPSPQGSAASSLRRGIADFAIALLIAIALAIPHCCFKGHHPAEMHFYPVLFAGSWLLHRCFGANGLVLSAKSRVYIVVLFTIFAFLNGLVWCDKMSAVYSRNAEAKALLAKLEARQIDYSKPVYFVVGPESGRYYSVFSNSAAHSVDFGGACRKFNGWRDFERHIVSPDDPIPENSQVVELK